MRIRAPQRHSRCRRRKFLKHPLRDIAIYPSNRLEKKQGDLKGYWGIWINDQWRIVFQWDGKDAYDVKIVDYH